MQGAHEVLAPASPQAAAIAQLATIFLALGALIWLLVLGFLGYSVLRPRGLTQHDHNALVARRQFRGVMLAVCVSAILLLALGFVDYSAGRKLATAPTMVSSSDTVHITLIGHQWWWEIQYDQLIPSDRVSTANEMHIPVGRPVQIKLESHDVIHSFWAPNLHGKTDLIPSYTGSIVFQADTPGVFRAPCAEFCGRQHAKMALLVVAEPQEQFSAWYANEQRSAAEPRDQLAAEGREIFMRASCPLCHTIRGTPSQGRVAPELTHLASRRMIAAGSLNNTRPNLGGWIMDPQAIKPGNFMPRNTVPARDLNPLLSYLASLR